MENYPKVSFLSSRERFKFNSTHNHEMKLAQIYFGDFGDWEKSQSVLKPFLKKSLKERVLKEQSSKTANMSTPSSAERLLLWMREMSYLERL